MKKFWTTENLNKVTNVLLENGEQNWCRICKEFNIVPGTPLCGVKNAHYSTGVVADYYDTIFYPWFNEEEETVIVQNPFRVAVSLVFECDFELPNTPFIKLNADDAEKILILGIPS